MNTNLFICAHFINLSKSPSTSWRHQMETFSVLLAICAGNSPVPGEFPAQRPVTRSFDVFFDLCLNKRLSKQWWSWWFETPSPPLWRHCNDVQAWCRRLTRCPIITWITATHEPQGIDNITLTAQNTTRLWAYDYNEVTWALWRHKSLTTLLFVHCFFRLTAKRINYLHYSLTICERNALVIDGFPSKSQYCGNHHYVWWRHHVHGIHSVARCRVASSILINNWSRISHLLRRNTISLLGSNALSTW